MKPGKQAQHTPAAAPQPASGAKGQPAPLPQASDEMARRASDVPAEDSDLSRALELWWDRTLAFFVRHRATSVLVVWLGVSLIDTIDLHMPAEWLVFTLFSFSVFVQAFSMSVLLFAALTIAMTVLNVAIYYLLPFSITSLFSTIVVCMLLVRGVHGLNAKGWMVTAALSLSRLHTPWCGILPDYLQAPIAAYCTSFGILWLLYHNSRRLERLVDPLCLLLGIIPPLPPRVGVVEIHDTSVVISWANSLASGPFDTHAPGTAPNAISAAGGGTGAGPGPATGPGSSSQGASTNAASESHSPPLSDALPGGAAAGTTSGAGTGTVAGGFGSSPSSSSSLSVGRLFTIDRRVLPEARVARYDIEVNGHVVGSCKAADSYTKIQGLRPAAMYQLRVWAVSQSRGRSPSLPVFVSTLTSAQSQMRENDAAGHLKQTGEDGAPVDVESLRLQIQKSQENLHEMEAVITQLRAQSEKERSKLQAEISELRARRKMEESSKGQQRDKIRDMEAQKRKLDREKTKLAKEIADAQAQKQRALERLRDQEKQVQSYIRNAKTLEATMERERKDHDHQQAELNSTISALKAEVEKAKKKLEALSGQQSDLAEKLKRKRAVLSAQEKRNAELDLQIKEAVLKKEHIEEVRVENANMAAKLHSEIEALSLKLESATKQRQKLEEECAKGLRPPRGSSLLVNQTQSQMQPHPKAPAVLPPATAPASIPALALALSRPMDLPFSEEGCSNSLDKSLLVRVADPASTSERLLSNKSPAHLLSGDGKVGAFGRHGRSSSFASNTKPLSASASAAKIPGFRKPASHNNGIYPYASSQNPATDAFVDPFALGYADTISRRSADLGDIFSLWDRRSNLLSSSAAIDSISLRNAAGAAAGSSGISSIDAAFKHRVSPVPGGLDTIGHFGNLPLWASADSLQSPSLSTTTAEASALSILKDTDLAYPTPTKATHDDVGPYAGSLGRSHHEYKSPQPPPPVYSMFGSGPSRFHQPALSGMLGGSVDGIDQLSKHHPHHLNQQNQHRYHHQRSSLSGSSDGSHFRFNSLDLRTAGAWADREFRESGRSSIVSDQRASPCADVGSAESRSSFTLRNGTPVEQPALVLSSDLIGHRHALGSTGASAGNSYRPHVDPIGAPTKRRAGGSPSPAAPERMHPPPPPPPPLQMPHHINKYPIEREISHPSSFGDSLYHKRSLWDLDTTKSSGQPSAANNDTQ
ncbi:hypothetical protein LPJ75_001044 [Coemansia sp. RSA 2598]|nr:hypothetical protein LPJ75_001044 [Coemansia sp. RSA 2598]